MDDLSIAAHIARIEALMLLRAADRIRLLVSSHDLDAASAAQSVGQANRIDIDADHALIRQIELAA